MKKLDEIQIDFNNHCLRMKNEHVLEQKDITNRINNLKKYFKLNLLYIGMLTFFYPIMIANLKANNVADKNVTYLVTHLATLERRLYQLYCLYGHYLKDTGNIIEYHLGYKVFEIFDNAFSNLIEVLEIPY